MSRQRAMKKQARKRTRSVWMAAGTLAAGMLTTSPTSDESRTYSGTLGSR